MACAHILAYFYKNNYFCKMDEKKPKNEFN